ncbi:MAG: hypothetical protein FWB91_09650 [Defluviitaleaceae bacterium]|nr:hypothetical protein [Defluviitaleaceae bacterium]
MFMVKGEYANIKNLLRVRLKTNAKSFKWILILLGLFVFVPFVGTIVGILQSNHVRFYNIGDFSLTIFFGIGLRYFVLMLMYRSTNDKLSVYPQTNNSRFISSLLYNFIEVFALAAFVLATYLIRYIIVWVLTLFMDNVHFALDFDLSFIIVGFFVYVAYSLLIVATIELIGVILRKWTYYAIVGFTAALSWMIANFSTVIENLRLRISFPSNVLAFFIEESSLINFFIKAIVLLVAITAIAVVINRYTVYYKNQGRSLNKGVVLGCIVVAIAVMVVLPYIFFVRPIYMTQTTGTVTEGAIIPVDDFFSGFEEIRIDISHIPNGSNIEVRVENREVVAEVVTGARFFSNTHMNISGAESLRNIQGDTLIISYRPSFFQANGIMLADFADSQLIANLDGNVLFVDYVIENVQVVFLPIWGMARQFDFFNDRNIFRTPIIGISAGGNITPNVWLRVE